MENLKENIAKIRNEIEKTAIKSGRNADEILLCAASKTQTPKTVMECAKSDVDLFGENRVQELLKNYEEGAYLDKPLHFIGHLQSNKAKMLVGKCDVIESVDSEKLLLIIDNEAKKQGIVQQIMIEVNIGEEENKSGVTLDELDNLLNAAEKINNIKIVGLMAIPPRVDTPEDSRVYFKKMKTLFDEVKTRKLHNFEGKYLSMGMSSDYKIAIEEGANIVRLGTSIFGKREYK